MTTNSRSVAQRSEGAHPASSKRMRAGRNRSTQIVAAAPSVLTYTDVDGDRVRITASAGDLTGHATIVGGQLRVLDLSDPMFNGASITFAVTRTGGGDGLAAVGRIVGGSNDFGTIVVKGDLGAITTGSGSATVPAVRSLRVQSMGSYGLATQGGGGNLASSFNGALGALAVAGDVKDAIIFAAGTIGPVAIGGSLIGGALDQSGSITARDGLGVVTIGGSIRGGGGVTSGAVACTQDVARVTVGGSLIGASGASSGVIFSAQGATGPVTIGGDVIGGAGPFSGRVFGRTKLGNVTVGGSFVGGGASDSGRIHSEGNIGAVSIGRDMVGGSGLHCGFIEGAGNMGALTIGGSLVGGTGDGTGSIEIIGDSGAVKIGRDVRGGTGSTTASIFVGNKLPAVTIGGSFIGGSGDSSASIVAQSMGAIKIGGDAVGAAGPPSAFIQSNGKIASVAIAGSLRAGAGGNSARIVSDGDMGPVTIGGDVQGQAIFSASIECRGKLAAVTIGGSLRGGTGRNSGWIFSQGDMGPIKIAGDFVGGSVGAGDPVLDRAGFIESDAGRIASVTIGGSVRAGTDNSGNVTGLLRNAAISAGNNIGPIVIEGSVAGSVGTNITRVTFTARGQAAPTATTDVAIGRLTVGGRAERMSVLAGWASNILPLNGNAQIGPISIGGDLVASHLIAGVRPVSGFGDVFGADTDFIIGNLPNSIARIASIVIGGVVIGTAVSGDRFGIESHAIGSLTINGFAVPLASPVSLSPLTGGDVTVRKV